MCEGVHPYIPANDVALVELIYDGPGGRMENNYHFLNTGGWNAGSLQGLADEMATWQQSSLRPLQSNQTILRMVRVSELSSPAGILIEEADPTWQAGAKTSPMLPSSVTAAIQFRTGTRGRSFRGRNFIIGLTEGDAVNDLITQQLTIDYTNAYSDLLSSQGWVSGDLVVVSYCNGGLWRETAVATEVTGYAMDNIIDSQRRRLLTRGS